MSSSFWNDYWGMKLGDKLKLATVALIFIFGIASCFMMPSKESVPKKDISGGYKYAAERYAQEYVKRNLKSPSTARFDEIDHSHVQSVGNDEYVVSSFVDSQNAFGAMLRNRFVVKLKITTEGENLIPHLEDIKFY